VKREQEQTKGTKKGLADLSPKARGVFVIGVIGDIRC
jgi:hypothetical protein